MLYHLKVQKYGETHALDLEIQIKNAVVIILSDPLDPTFLALLHLTPTIFEELVKEQDLRMEYDQFVEQFKELLNKEEWTIVFDKESQFKLVEITSWRAICHLKLKMEIPSVEVKNDYLAAKILSEKNDHSLLKTKSAKNEARLNAEIRQYSLKIKELQDSLNEKTSAFINQQSKFQQELKDITAQNELDMSNLDKDLNTLLSESKQSVRALQTENESLKMQLSTLKNQNSALQNELQRFQQESTRQLQDQQQVNRDCNNYQNQLAISKNRISLLEEEIKSKSFHISRIESDLNSNIQEKQEIERKVSDLENQLKSVASSVNNTNNEVNKGNTIIEQLEMELKNSKNKLKLSTQLALTQEKKINQLSAELKQYKSNYNESELEFDNVEHENTNLKKKLNFANTRLEAKNGKAH
eukprot:NODE_235_length_13458_cov_0.279737.p3 type:complete len:413 gc:universal NODE_235_length_13458_cov_0.279737:4375-3137(-)